MRCAALYTRILINFVGLNQQMEQLHKILKEYWGYEAFRPMQQEIIQSVLNGKDTLALLPTGGGKSLCFQVPALAREGLCVVVSPLIALMKDQVANLKKRGIPAYALYSGMHRKEIELVINQCLFGGAKFLYLSPERLKTQMILQNLERMPVSLLAVDEAHCISQWGYDFRPPYLEIAAIRHLIPKAPVLALTATATPDVVEDIQKKLEFKAPNVFRKSFARENLTYVVIKEDDKLRRLLRIARKMGGTGVVYVRNRRKTRDIARYLQQNGISAGAYHAGLSPQERDRQQALWMQNQQRVMVATNAFGMGIDKPDVRFVVHMDVPDTPEAYFQEAGRAGRDEQSAYAVMLYNQENVIDARHLFGSTWPEPDFIRNVYRALGNYFQLAIGSGAEQSFSFDLTTFSSQYNMKALEVFSAIKILEREGYLVLNEAFNAPSRLMFNAGKEDIYNFQLQNPAYDGFLKVLLRSYAGVFSAFTRIDEKSLARRLKSLPELVRKTLLKLDQMGLLYYYPQNEAAQIVYVHPRIHDKELLLSKAIYFQQKARALERLDAMMNYLTVDNVCRSQQLLAYFGEADGQSCGSCDVCLAIHKNQLNNTDFEAVVRQIKPLLQAEPCPMEQLVEQVEGVKEEKVLKVIQWLMDNDQIINNQYVLSWKPEQG